MLRFGSCSNSGGVCEETMYLALITHAEDCEPAWSRLDSSALVCISKAIRDLSNLNGDIRTGIPLAVFGTIQIVQQYAL